jgi:hypothetical protein
MHIREVNVIFSNLRISKSRIFLLGLFDWQSFAMAPSGLQIKVYYYPLFKIKRTE